jgi:hypothetical protein
MFTLPLLASPQLHNNVSTALRIGIVHYTISQLMGLPLGMLLLPYTTLPLLFLPFFSLSYGPTLATIFSAPDNNNPKGMRGYARDPSSDSYVTYALPKDAFLFPTTNSYYPVDRIMVFKVIQ